MLARRKRGSRGVAAVALVLLAASLGAHDAVAVAAEVYRIDPVHSSVLFRIRHLGISYSYGRFRDVSGTLQLDAEHPERSTVQVEIDPASIDTENEKRDRHLRSADFFDVERFPTLTFTSTAVKKVDDETYTITGNLTMHGVTRPVDVQMKLTGSGPDPWGGHRAAFEGNAVVRRSDFGVDHFDAGAPGALGDEVQLTLSVEAVRR